MAEYTTRFFAARHAEPLGNMKKLGYHLDPATGATEPCVYDNSAELSPQGMIDAWRLYATICKLKEGDGRDISIGIFGPWLRARLTALPFLMDANGPTVHEIAVTSRMSDLWPFTRRDASLPRHLAGNYMHPIEMSVGSPRSERNILNELSDDDCPFPEAAFASLTTTASHINNLGDILARDYAGTDILVVAHAYTVGILVGSLLGKYRGWQDARTLHKNYRPALAEGYIVTVHEHEDPAPDNSMLAPSRRSVMCTPLKLDHTIPIPPYNEIAAAFNSPKAHMLLNGMLQNTFSQDL